MTDGPLRILIVHNRYQLRGGEDTVVDADVDALRARGHEVELLEGHNDDHVHINRRTVARHAIWSPRAARQVSDEVRSFRPHIAHVHNHAYALSASIFPALAEAGVPVVSTLHNFRMTCSNAYLLRDGKHCELCVGKRSSTGGIRHACFRGSRSASAMVAGMQLAYRRSAMPTIARWLTPSAHTRDVHVRADFPAERVFVHPNAVADHGVGTPSEREHAVLFVGRLSEEKGVRTLLHAWSAARPPTGAVLQIVGDGPLAPELAQLVADRADIQLLGARGSEAVANCMRAARCVVVPSIWPETFGLVAVEAFATATPVIATDIGALADLVTDDVGWRFVSGDAAALRVRIDLALSDGAGAAAKGLAARAAYEASFTMDTRIDALERHYRSLL